MRTEAALATRLFGVTCTSMLILFCGVLLARAQKQQLVAANVRWVDTGITVGEGQALRISASGQWSNGGDQPRLVGPDGFLGFSMAGSLLPSANLASLIGKIDSTIFSIGSNYSRISSVSGELFLSMNDLPNAFADNIGSLSVSVELNESNIQTQAAGSQPVNGFPGRLQVCETKDCDPHSIALWIFHGSKGTALSSFGYAKLTVEQFDGKKVLISRVDPPGTSSAGLTAFYEGTLTGDRFEGPVTWKWPGHWDEKPVSYRWYGTIQPVPDDPVLASWDFDCDPVPGMPAAVGNPLAAAKFFFEQKNDKQAFCWTQTAVLLYGSPKAQSVLALMYSNGIGVAPDIQEAFKWSESAAASGAPLPQEQRQQIANAAMMKMANVKPGATMNPLGPLILGFLFGSDGGKWSEDRWNSECSLRGDLQSNESECIEHQHDF